MKALRRQAREARAVALEEIEEPSPGPGQVLLQVQHCGVCGSDLHVYLNHKGYESVLPQVTLGHEWAGIVVDCGDGVDRWQQGQAATMIALQGCLRTDCSYCSSGLTQLCPERRVQGLHLDGGMAERVVVDDHYLLPLPDGIIWHDPGVPSLLITYGVANDFFFSGHTGIAVLGALEFARRYGRIGIIAGMFLCIFEVVTVLVLRAHYTMDVIAGAAIAILAALAASRLADSCDQSLNRLAGSQ